MAAVPGTHGTHGTETGTLVCRLSVRPPRLAAKQMFFAPKQQNNNITAPWLLNATSYGYRKLSPTTARTAHTLRGSGMPFGSHILSLHPEHISLCQLAINFNKFTFDCRRFSSVLGCDERTGLPECDHIPFFLSSFLLSGYAFAPPTLVPRYGHAVSTAPRNGIRFKPGIRAPALARCDRLS